MDRFYSVLARSIGEIRRTDPEARAAIYDQARRQLARLIADAEPRMSAETEFAYRGDLEDAIARIETECSADGDAVSTSASVAGALVDQQAGAADTAPPVSPVVSPRRDGRIAQGTGSWDDRKAFDPRLRRLAVFATFVLFGLAAIGVGGWILVSSLYPPEVPGMDTVFRRLQERGASVLFVGSGANRFRDGGGTNVSAVSELFGQGAVRIETRRKATAETGPRDGARIILSRDIRPLFNDATLRVVVMARADPDNPSREFAVAITDGETGSSDWQPFAIATDFESYTVEYAFDASLPDQPPSISLIADTAGQGRAIQVREVSLRILPE